MMLYVYFVVFAFAFALGCLFLGRYLRAKGHGDKLDRWANAWDKRVVPRQQRFARTVAGGLFGAAKAMNSAPLLGSKVSRENADRAMKSINAMPIEQPVSRRTM